MKSILKEEKGPTGKVRLSIESGERILWEKTIPLFKVEEYRERAYTVIRRMENV